MEGRVACSFPSPCRGVIHPPSLLMSGEIFVRAAEEGALYSADEGGQVC